MIQKIRSIVSLKNNQHNYTNVQGATNNGSEQFSALEEMELSGNFQKDKDYSKKYQGRNHNNIHNYVLYFLFLLMALLILYLLNNYIRGTTGFQSNQNILITDPPEQKQKQDFNKEISQIQNTFQIKTQSKFNQDIQQKPKQIQKNAQQQKIKESNQQYQNQPSKQMNNEDQIRVFDNQKSEVEDLIQRIKPFRATNLKLKTPELYINTFLTPISKQLPLCILSRNLQTQQSLQSIAESLSTQNYTNYKIVYSSSKQFEALTSSTVIFSHAQDGSDLEVFALKKMSEKGCHRKSILVILKDRVKPNLLKSLNLIYQRENIWMTYDSHQKNYSSVNSFYYQVLKQISYEKIKIMPIQADQIHQLETFAGSLIRLCRYHSEAFPISWFYYKKPQSQGIEYFSGLIKTTLSTYSSPMMYFDPNFQTEEEVKKFLKCLNTTNPPQNKYKPRNLIDLPRMLEALQYYSLKDLPENHTLFEREIAEYEAKYGLSKYQDEVSLCIIVLTRDNIDGHRYKRVLQSIEIQNYTNFHIVFIDDASKDRTYEQSYRYLEEARLLDKTQMIKNKEQMFATYNIQNAIYNYCKSGEVAVLVDGDDELIGKQVFKLINFGYQQKSNWIVYFSFFSTIYMYGVSQVPLPQFFETDTPRKQNKIIGALRTFYVDLYRKIEMKDHKDDQGQFFDRLYDDAMQHPLLQMSGFQHTRYIPEVVYFYNQNYGRNDGSSQQGRNDWKKHEKQVLSRPKYQPLEKLFDNN